MTRTYSFTTLYSQIKAQKADFWRANLYGVLATLLLLPLPLLIPLLIDEIILGHPGRMTAILNRICGPLEPWGYIGVIFALVLLLRILAFICTNTKSLHANRITQQVGYLLRDQILRHLERVSISEYETLKSGGIASKTVQDVESISDFAGLVVTTFLSASLMLTGIGVIMLWMHWGLALLVFILNPFFLAFSKILGRKTAKLLRRQHESYELYHELLNETLELITQIRAGNQGGNFFGILRQKAQDIQQASLEYSYKAAVAGNSSTLVTNVAVDLFRVLGIAAVVYADLSLGMMLAFLFYLSTLAAPIQQLMGVVIGYQASKPGLQRINDMLSLEQEPDFPSLANPFAGVQTTSVVLRNINFGYPSGKQILYDVSLRAEPGQKVALIGPSGSGKTTLAQLLVGFYHPDSGTICFGANSLEETGLALVRENVALMLQQALFFNDTLRMNLSPAGKISEAQMYEALRAAQLETFVRNLEDGLDTRIGKSGIRLSGGQRQRLAIARLILADPKIVIFDEATSALDTVTELQLYETLASFLEGRTTIIIAHRSTTIRQADYIYLIVDGRVQAEGTYAALQGEGLIREDFDAG